MGTEIDLIVGLGNPGPEYQTTRHNAGFWFVDLLAREHGGRFARERKLKGESAEVRIAGRRIRLLKPMTYMNASGESVQAAVSYYKIPRRARARRLRRARLSARPRAAQVRRQRRGPQRRRQRDRARRHEVLAAALRRRTPARRATDGGPQAT